MFLWVDFYNWSSSWNSLANVLSSPSKIVGKKTSVMSPPLYLKFSYPPTAEHCNCIYMVLPFVILLSKALFLLCLLLLLKFIINRALSSIRKGLLTPLEHGLSEPQHSSPQLPEHFIGKVTMEFSPGRCWSAPRTSCGPTNSVKAIRRKEKKIIFLFSILWEKKILKWVKYP